MALQHDDQGFITGGVPVASIRRTTDLLSAIRSDVLAIKNAVVRGANRTASQQNNASVIPFPTQRTQAVVAVTPNRRESTNTHARARDEHGRYASTPVATPSREPVVAQDSSANIDSTAQQNPVVIDNAALSSQLQANTVALNAAPVTDVVATSNRTVATPSRSRRDASGRFSARNVSENSERANATRDRAGRFASNGDSDSQGSRQSESSMLGRFADRIATSISTVNAGGLENVDPTVMAAQEISQVATPLVRGFQVLTGGDKGDKGDSKWFRKILSVLTLTRRESSVFQRTANRRLVNIDNNTEDDGSGGGDGGQSFLGGLLGSISPWIMTAVAGIGTALVGGIGAVLGVIFSPIGLAIGAAAAIAWGLFTENGQKFFGEIGAKIIAGWEFVTAAFAPLTESISAAWTVVTAQFEPIATSIGESWDSVKGGFDSLIDGMVSSWNAFTGFLKDKFGIDIPAIFKPVVDVGKKVIDKVKSGVETVKDVSKSVANKAIDKAKSFGEKANSFIKEKTGVDVKQSASNAVGNVQEGVSNISSKVAEGATKIASHATGKTATNKEAMLAEIDAQGITDPKERAMIMAQVDHESGGFAYTKELGKDSYFDKYDAGTRKGKNLGNTEKGDGAKYKGRGFMQLTGKANYEAASKDLGVDLVSHPELAETPDMAAKTAMWFWKKNKLSGAAQDGDIKKVTKRINGGYNGLADREEKYSKYLAEANSGSLKPSEAANNKPIQIAAINNAIPVQSASVPSPSLPSTPKAAPAVAEATPVMAPMAGDSGRKDMSITVAQGDAGQDVTDRKIAHLVTGGLSG